MLTHPGGWCCRLFGPRKKMTNAIARWHSQAPAARSSLEQAYADRLEGEMQEMAIQLNQVGVWVCVGGWVGIVHG